MSIIDEVIKKNTLKLPQNELTQEFVVRVKVSAQSADPKVIRAILDGVATTLDGVHYATEAGKVEVTQVYAK